MSRTRFGLGIALVVLALGPGASSGQAQAIGTSGVFSDPFSLYYGLYLPRQAAIASQTTSTDIIGAAAVNRQDSVTNSDAAGALGADIQPFGLEDLDPTAPVGGRNRRQRSRVALYQQSKSGQGPSRYYGPANLARYYPNTKPGHYTNRNIATTRGTFGQVGRSGLQGRSVSQGGMGNQGGYQ